jgi:hypothetical protein
MMPRRPADTNTYVQFTDIRKMPIITGELLKYLSFAEILLVAKRMSFWDFCSLRNLRTFSLKYFVLN